MATRTYAPYGRLLAKEGDGAALFGYAGGQAGVDGLWYFGDGYYDPQTGEFLAAGKSIPPAPLAAAGGLLFAPMLLWGWRRKKKGKGWLPPAGLFMLVLFVAAGLTSCDGQEGHSSSTNSPTLPPETSTPTSTSTATATGVPTRPIPTATVVTITPSPTCTPSPTAASTSTPTVISTDDPLPVIPGEANILINFTYKPENYPTPTPTPTPIATPTNDSVHGNRFNPWSENDKKQIQKGAEDTAKALRSAIIDLHPSWRTLEAQEAFRLVYHGAVSFTMTNRTCMQETGFSDCWGKSKVIDGTKRQNVDVFTDAILTSTNADHWAVHELGHCFVYAVGEKQASASSPIKILENAIIANRLLDRPTRDIGAEKGNDRLLNNDENGNYGFFGNRWEWQRSKSTSESEIFADQYLGWVYGKWELSPAGLARKRFMDNYMATWIELAINNR